MNNQHEMKTGQDSRPRCNLLPKVVYNGFDADPKIQVHDLATMKDENKHTATPQLLDKVA